MPSIHSQHSHGSRVSVKVSPQGLSVPVQLLFYLRGLSLKQGLKIISDGMPLTYMSRLNQEARQSNCPLQKFYSWAQEN